MYQITNKIDGRIYIGVHRTNDLDDGYMGSGIHLLRAQQKYGLENFNKIILEFFETEEGMFSREAEVVTVEFLQQEHVYNMKEGGLGGFPQYASYKGAKALGDKYGHHNAEVLWPKWKENRTGIFSEESRRKNIEASKNRDNSYNTGHPHTEETRERLRKIAKDHRYGAPKGSHWITNEIQNKKIMPNEPIPEGWRIGRKKTSRQET